MQFVSFFIEQRNLFIRSLTTCRSFGMLLHQMFCCKIKRNGDGRSLLRGARLQG